MYIEFVIGEKMFDAINQGTVTLSINGKPILSLDGDTKSFELEMVGLEEANLKLSDLFETKTTRGKILLKSAGFVRRLAKNGWKFSLYDKGEEILTTRGLSRFGPRLHFNPLKLSQILKVVRF